MCLERVLCLGLLLVLLQSAVCSPVAKNSTSIVFKSTDIVEVHGAKLSALNCTLSGPTRRVCANITEVTCEQVKNYNIKNCLITNKPFYGIPVEHHGWACVDQKVSQGKCVLYFRLRTGLFHAKWIGPSSKDLYESHLKETEKPVNGNEKSVREIEKPTTGTEKPAMKLEKWTMEILKLATETEKATKETEKPAMETKKPATERPLKHGLIKSSFDDDDWFEKRKKKMDNDANFFFVCFGIVFGLM